MTNRALATLAEKSRPRKFGRAERSEKKVKVQLPIILKSVNLTEYPNRSESSVNT